MINYIQNHICPELLKKPFPFINLHGDLWPKNVLLGDQFTVYYIDFEYSDQYIFLYDLLWFLIQSAKLMSNDVFIENYCTGQYDQYFALVFQDFELEYNPSHRIDYLHLFYLNHWIKRCDLWEDSVRIFFFSEYKRLIKKIEGISNSMTVKVNDTGCF